MLDSELVVASLRKDGYELTANARTTPTRSCSTPAASANMPRTKSTAPSAASKTPSASIPDKVIGVLGCMAQKDQGLIFKRAPYVDLIVGPGQLHQMPALDSRSRAPKARARSGWKSASAARTAAATKSSAATKASIRSAIPTMRPTPYQAYVRIMIGCDKFCTYCIVPSVRGPEQSRPPSAILAEVAPTRRRRLPRNHAARPNRQQLQVSTKATARWRLTDLLERAARHRRHRPHQVRHELSQGHDGRPARRRPRSAEGAASICTCRRKAARTTCLQRMKRGYTVEDYREMLARTYEWIPGVAVTQRLHRRLLRRDRGRVPAHDGPRPRVALQEQLHLQIQRTPRHQGRRPVPRRRSRRRQTPPQQRAARPPKRNQRRRQPRLPRPRGRDPGRRPQQSQPKSSRRPAMPNSQQLCNSPAAPTAIESSSSTAIRRQIGHIPADRRSTTPTPTRCSAKSSPGTSVPSYSRFPFRRKRPESLRPERLR